MSIFRYLILKSNALLLPAVALMLSACDPVSERECGIFDHPDLEVWEANLGASSVLFMNEEGTSINFTRSAVELNEPFLGSDGSSNDEDVICLLSASIRYVADDSSLAISSVYLQNERFLLESADEILAVNHVIEAPADTTLEGSYLADISVDSTRTILSSSRILYLETEDDTEVVGGIAYQDVVRVNAPGFLFVGQENDEGETETVVVDTRATETDENSDQTADNGTVSEAAVVVASDVVRQVVLGRQAGLIAFTDEDGNEFVRISE